MDLVATRNLGVVRGGQQVLRPNARVRGTRDPTPRNYVRYLSAVNVAGFIGVACPAVPVPLFRGSFVFVDFTDAVPPWVRHGSPTRASVSWTPAPRDVNDVVSGAQVQPLIDAEVM